MPGWANAWRPWLLTLLMAAATVGLALAVHAVGRLVLKRLARHSTLLTAVLDACAAPAGVALPLLGLQLLWQAAADDLAGISSVRHANGVLLLAALTWLAMRAVGGVAAGIVAAHPSTMADNLQARRIHTQAQVLSRTVMAGLLVAGTALVLMTFPGARQIGTSLLASAGIVGLAAGIAARPVFSNLMAGLQIALAQPIRIDDVLIVQGEWGRVEEITGTYVVLAIWDQRRLIIPLNWFMENPFQNWTRRSSEITGTVFLQVGYGMPLAPLRAEAQRLCEASPHWDRRLCLLQVTDTSEQGIQLRLLLTSSDASQSWDLRCEVREGLVAFMQRDYPQHLPAWRARLESAAGADDPASAQQILAFEEVPP